MKKKKIDAELQRIKNNENNKKLDVKALIQNTTNNVSVEVNPSELASLAKIDASLAGAYLSILKNNQEHIQEMDKEILTLERTEQSARIKDIERNRAYINIGQWLAFIIMLFALGILAYAIHKGETGFAITSVVGILLLSLYHISGKYRKIANPMLPSQDKEADEVNQKN